MDAPYHPIQHISGRHKDVQSGRTRGRNSDTGHLQLYLTPISILEEKGIKYPNVWYCDSQNVGLSVKRLKFK